MQSSQPQQQAAYASNQSYSSNDPSGSSVTATSQGYALPLQLDDESVWDYFHTAYPMEASPETLDALHQYNIAIATGVACWSTQFATPISFPSEPPKAGDLVSVPISGQWLIDSGASNHFTNSKHLLSDYRSCPEQRILTGNGYIVAEGIGNVTIHCSVGLRTIFDVLYVPRLARKHNLLSIPQLVRKGCIVTMSRDGCKVSTADSSVTLLEGSFTGKGFLLDMSVCRATSQVAQLTLHPLINTGTAALFPDHLRHLGQLTSLPDLVSNSAPNGVAMLAGVTDTQPLEIWHLRLGHLNQASIQLLASHATGLNIGPARPLTISM